MRPFDYVAPASLSAALQALSAPDARPLAGGTDLINQLKEGRRHYARIVDIKHVPELRELHFDPQNGLRLGASVSCNQIYTHAVIREQYPALAQATALIGSVQIQNRASLGGNLCNAAPSADGIPALILYGAVAVIAGQSGERRVPVESFCTGPGKTVLQPGELLVRFELPPPAPHSSAHYLRFIPRNEMDIAVAGAGAWLLVQNGKIEAARIALSAVAPVPVRALAAEAALIGQSPAPELFERAGQLAVEATHPISDVRGSADFRRHLVRVLTRRALEQSAQRLAA